MSGTTPAGGGPTRSCAPGPPDAAVALFAKAPVPGGVKTRLSPPLTPQEAALVARALLAATIESLVDAIPAQWTLFLDGPADEETGTLVSTRGMAIRPQAAGDLGARLTAAFRALRSGGARRVLAVGADSPTLPPRLVAEAIDALSSCDLVLGPAEDGGYYLVGLAAPREEIFRDVAWSTDSVLSTTLARAAEARLTVRLLPPWYDVDSFEDLRRLREEIRSGTAPQALRALFDALEGRI